MKYILDMNIWSWMALYPPVLQGETPDSSPVAITGAGYFFFEIIFVYSDLLGEDKLNKIPTK